VAWFDSHLKPVRAGAEAERIVTSALASVTA